MKKALNNISSVVLQNRKVIENYIFMTMLLILNSLFGIITYPLVIDALGKDEYGVFVFGTSLANFFVTFVGFGFDLFGVREIANNYELKKKSRIVSVIFSAKIFLMIISVIVFAILTNFIPVLKNHYLVYWICFSNTLVNIFFPTWYFQGVQKMRIVTYIQVIFKMIAIPLIIILIKKPSDLPLFAAIMVGSNLFGGIYGFIHLTVIEKVKIYWTGMGTVMDYIKKSRYFFYANACNVAKGQLLNIITGLFFGMGSLAVYDLAYKVVSLPTTLLASINGAILPKILLDFRDSLFKKILRYEQFVAVVAIIGTIVAAPFLIHLLGGETMKDAYPLTIILSFSLYPVLISSCHLNLLFIVKRMDKYITLDLVVAAMSVVIFLFAGLYLTHSIYAIPVAMVLSLFTEVIFQKYVIYKEKLL